jgi:hypothetical protein
MISWYQLCTTRLDPLLLESSLRRCPCEASISPCTTRLDPLSVHGECLKPLTSPGTPTGHDRLMCCVICLITGVRLSEALAP